MSAIDSTGSWSRLGRTPVSVRLGQQMLDAVQPELDQRLAAASFERHRVASSGPSETPGLETTLFAPEDAGLRVRAAELEARLRTRRAPASPDEKLRLLAEQGQLASKRFTDEGLSPAEARRLAYVRWQIDRIEEAEDAPLDRLARLRADVAEQVAAFRAEVDELATKFQGGLPGRPPGRGPRRRRAK